MYTIIYQFAPVLFFLPEALSLAVWKYEGPRLRKTSHLQRRSGAFPLFLSHKCPKASFSFFFYFRCPIRNETNPCIFLFFFLTEWTFCLLLHTSLKLRGYKCTSKRLLLCFYDGWQINFLPVDVGLSFSHMPGVRKSLSFSRLLCSVTFAFPCSLYLSVSLAL